MTEGIIKERLLFWNDLDTKDLTSHELLEILFALGTGVMIINHG